ncbi:MAG: carboxypeptidase-like regulatory domain-containing protein, partial [Muribaculaceae bacterium]|nr:carboxypeptidase-like regulatory domain-containing protein [Muribaculaceae bacterium]
MVAFLLSVIAIGASAQNSITVRGTITDDSGEPLTGAFVKLNGTSTAAAADIDGKYEISAPADGTLTFSYVGYTPKVEQIKGRTTIDVVLTENSQQLDEVVVIGYGTQKKADLTG